jgi:hypothetical protein
VRPLPFQLHGVHRIDQGYRIDTGLDRGPMTV